MALARRGGRHPKAAVEERVAIVEINRALSIW
jgi:hypothetical protein